LNWRPSNDLHPLDIRTNSTMDLTADRES
jgi:hypothetical protein